MRSIHAILENTENLYTLNPYTTKSSTNYKDREKMKKFLTVAVEVVLTDKQRQVVEMYYIDNKNIPEIAEILGKNKSTVQRTLNTAVEKLKKSLKNI